MGRKESNQTNQTKQGPDLSPNCLQRLSADNKVPTSMERDNHTYVHLLQRRFRRIYLSTNPSPHDPQNLLLAQTNRPMKTPGRIFSIIPSCQSD